MSALESLSEQVRRTNCWNGGDDFTKLEFVQDGGLTSSVKTDLEYGC